MTKARLKPSIIESFTYNGVVYRLEFFEIDNKNDIPDLPWEQIYAIGNFNNSVPVVRYQSQNDNLPGGHVEKGESLEDALRRELKEELNMSLIEWQPLGYQKNSSEDGKEVSYQFRAYASLERDGDFVGDTGGLVTGYDLVPIGQLNDRIKWGQLGKWFEERLSSKYIL